MIPVKQLARLWHIRQVLLKNGLDELLRGTQLFGPLRWLISAKFRPALHKGPLAVRIRYALEELGPIFIKFGQMLSTRRDLLPNDIADELAKLQDKVAPFPGKEAHDLIETAMGQPLTLVFQEFETEPFASASIAQVHGARLHNGRNVVIKVLRPHIEQRIQRDVRLLYTLARLVERHWKESRRLHPVAVVAEYEKTLLDELDLMREAANASQLRRNFQESCQLYVPEIEWSYCRGNVLVMERIYGIPVGDIARLRQQGIDLQLLAETGVEIFFTQVFRDNFFHADMHPGNIFVSEEGVYISVDFGIMGTLTTSDQRYLAENLLAFFNRDYRRVAELHVESEWVAPTTRVDEFESAIRAVCEPIFDRPLKDISFGLFLLNLFQTARRFDMEVQPQLVLLQKTLLNIEGLGRQLHPELDLWKTAKPFLERWVKQQVGPMAFVRRVRDNFPLWTERLPEIPTLGYQVLQKAAAGRLQIVLREEATQTLRQELRALGRRVTAAVAGASLVLSMSLFISSTAEDAEVYLPVSLGFFLGLLLLGYAWRHER